ncbi:MAG TPA: hypothetical protein PK141_04420 [Polyangiaceae bacterium]|nr:hypothetical protein [Polyangiaceae bacterium]
MPTLRKWLPVFAIAAGAAGAFVTAAGPVAAAPNKDLKQLMKQLESATAAGDTATMASLFTKTKGFAKPEYATWGTLSEQGRAAAAGGDVASAKATCKSCHSEYKSAYRAKYGSRAP